MLARVLADELTPVVGVAAATVSLTDHGQVLEHVGNGPPVVLVALEREEREVLRFGQAPLRQANDGELPLRLAQDRVRFAARQ